jgi:phage tail sheath gpL-like
MSITFDSIPVGIYTPGSFVEFSSVRNSSGLAPWARRILILGQMTAGAPAAPATLLPINTDLDGQPLFGRGSMLDREIQAVFDVNSTTETWAMAVADNGAGVAATYATTITSGPTAAGTLAFYVAGQSVPVAVTAGMTPTQVALAIGLAINANPDLPVQSGAVGAVVTHTVRWKGLTGNGLDFRINYESGDVTPAGLTLTTIAVTAGAGDPDLTAAIAAMGDQQWHTIVCPWSSSAALTALIAELTTRADGLHQIEGQAFSAATGSQGSLATLGESVNSQYLSIAECVGPTPVWERAAREAGAIDFQLGIDPARPLQTVPLTGDNAPNPSERFTRAQRDALLHDGISTHTVDAGGNVLLERPITTYRLNAAGFPDASYLDVTTVATQGYLRYTLRARIAQKYPRHKLADDGIAIAPGQPIVTPKTLSAELLALAREWEAAGLVENVDEFKSLLVVQRNTTDRSRVDAVIPPDIVSGLRVFAGQIQFAL